MLRSILTGLLCALLPVVPSTAATVTAVPASAQATSVVAVTSTSDSPVPVSDQSGARALWGGDWGSPEVGPGDVTSHGPVLPQPGQETIAERPGHYDDGCHAGVSRTRLIPGCVYGDPDGTVRVAVVGDSKIGRYFPALEEIARREGWAMRMYTKSSCPFVDDPVAGYAQCDEFNAALRAELEADPPQIVLTTSLRRSLSTSYVRTWQRLQSTGVESVGALWDSPDPGTDLPTCVAEAVAAGTDLRGCATALDDAHSGNPSMRSAARQVDIAHFVDLRPWACPSSELSPRCPAVVGRVQLFGLGSHLTPSFTATLTDPLHQQLFEAGIAAHRPSVDRVSGPDRYATAAALSSGLTPGGRVFVVNGEVFPDALSASARAGDGHSAVLLTKPDALPAATRSALRRLDPREIVVVGGEGAVSKEVLGALRRYAPTVQRVAGGNRYETAAALTELVPRPTGGTVYLASGADFPDALAAAARAGHEDSSILLVQPDRIPAVTRAALTGLDPARVVVAGGTASVSDGVLTTLREELGLTVERRGGIDRYATAARLSEGVQPRTESFVASGLSFPDALAAAPLAAAGGGAVLLVKDDSVPQSTSQAITRLDPSRLVLGGGVGAVSEEVRRSLIRLVR